MPHLEPTYLRYIYDGLVKGSIHPENAAELPEGLIGLYEEAFDERTSVVERQKLLQRFAICALLKKEVSAAFVAEVLRETEDEIQDFISTYSAWFNSPESGKYQLYHERLKVYLLQKLSDGEVHVLHEKLIVRLEKAIEEQQADEFEWYGLEFLAGHLGVSAMLNRDGQKLLNLAYFQIQWQRQLKISKGYNWTKNGLKAVMTWASKYNDDEVIECGLQMVDLHHQEQNAAPQIVALVAEGDFDAALKRIEQFGGNDEKGLQRKFILYMLCLMELTLLDSKDKPFRKEGIEKLLKHLDEQLPMDYSVLTWNSFFPSYLIFQMACEAYELGIEFDSVFKRTEEFDCEWIQLKGPYSKDALVVMENMLWDISDEENKQELIKLIMVEFAKQNQIKFINSMLRKIDDDELRDECINLVAIEFALIGKLKKSLSFKNLIKDASKRNGCLFIIIDQLIQKNNLSKYEVETLLKEFTIRYYTVKAFCIFSNHLYDKKDDNWISPLNNAISLSKNIQNESWLLMSKRIIAATFINQRKFSKACKIIQETFEIETNRDDLKDFHLSQIISLFTINKKYDLALNVSNKIFDQRNRVHETAKILVLKGKVDEGFKLVFDQKDRAQVYLKYFIIELITLGKYSLAARYSKNINDESNLCDIGIAFLEAGRIEIVHELLQSKCKVSWDNPKQQLVQLLFDTNNTYQLDIILKDIYIQNGAFESLNILFWIINNPQLISISPNLYKRIVKCYCVESQINNIRDTLLKQITFEKSSTSHNLILKNLFGILFKMKFYDNAVFVLKNITDIKEQLRVINKVLDFEIENQYPAKNNQKNKQYLLPIIEQIDKDLESDLLIEIYLKLDDIYILEEYLKKKPSSDLRIVDLINIANFHNQKGYNIESDRYFNKVEEYQKNNPDSYSRINDLIFISKSYNQKKDKVNSNRYVDFAISEIEKNEDLEDKCSWFHELALISFNNKSIVKARNLIKKSIDCLKFVDEDFACMEIHYIAELLCELGDFDRAIKLINEGDEYSKILNFSFIIPVLILKREEVYCNQIFVIAKEKKDKVKLYIAAAKGWFKLERFSESNEIMKMAIAFASEIIDLSEKSNSFQEIVEEFINQEKWFAAAEYLESISLKQNQLQVAKNLGERVAQKYLENEIQILNNQFSSPILRNAFWKGITKEIKPVVIDRKMILHNLKMNYWENETFIYFLEIETVKQMFLNQPELPKEELISKLNLQWAIDIKNQLPN